MDQFRTIAKLWPSGTDLDLGTDFQSVTVPSSFDRHAANFVTSVDGTHNYQFLFWNTGRHTTNKRHVHWNFSAGGWGLWTATRWYGTPPPIGSSGPARVHADAFTIGGNTLLTGDTPIDGAASIYAPGAWPFNGNNHEIGTAAGAATVVPNDPFASLQFAGWLQLVWGGNDSDTFYEDDSGSSPSSQDFFEHISGPYLAAMGQSVDLLATYGNHTGNTLHLSLADLFRELVPNFPPIQLNVDPSPIDLVRLKLLEDLMRQARPSADVGVGFQNLIDGAPKMSQDELTRAMKSVQTSLDLGKIALSTIQSQIKRGEKK